MATIEGNEIALRKVASELIPPVRNGQDAQTDQDNFGSPFVTVQYKISNDFAIIDPTSGTPTYGISFAPSWVYGLVIEPSWGAFNETSRSASGVDAPRFFAAFGQASTSNEVELQPGKVLSFPRGARRIYLRTDSPSYNYTIRVTWIVDRFASIANSGADGVSTVRTWFGDGNLDSVSLNNTQLALTLAQLDGYTNFAAMVVNNTNQVVAYELELLGNVIDTGNVPSTDFRLVSYGPGVGNLAGKMVGHGIVIPNFGSVRFNLSTTVPATGTVETSWRGY
jgi:hypothetical protein